MPKKKHGRSKKVREVSRPTSKCQRSGVGKRKQLGAIESIRKSIGHCATQSFKRDGCSFDMKVDPTAWHDLVVDVDCLKPVDRQVASQRSTDDKKCDYFVFGECKKTEVLCVVIIEMKGGTGSLTTAVKQLQSSASIVEKHCPKGIPFRFHPVILYGGKGGPTTSALRTINALSNRVAFRGVKKNARLRKCGHDVAEFVSV